MSTTVAFLGPAGTFTEEAMQRFAAQLGETTPLPVGSPQKALATVRSGEADYACVAIENSVDGPVTATFDALAEGVPVQIYREVDLPVSFSILTRGTAVQDIQIFSTHPVAYQQVRGWLEENLPGVEFIPAASNRGRAGRGPRRGGCGGGPGPRRGGL